MKLMASGVTNSAARVRSPSFSRSSSSTTTIMRPARTSASAPGTSVKGGSKVRADSGIDLSILADGGGKGQKGQARWPPTWAFSGTNRPFGTTGRACPLCFGFEDIHDTPHIVVKHCLALAKAIPLSDIFPAAFNQRKIRASSITDMQVFAAVPLTIVDRRNSFADHRLHLRRFNRKHLLDWLAFDIPQTHFADPSELRA